jgi:hypothetical protein
MLYSSLPRFHIGAFQLLKGIIAKRRREGKPQQDLLKFLEKGNEIKVA